MYNLPDQSILDWLGVTDADLAINPNANSTDSSNLGLFKSPNAFIENMLIQVGVRTSDYIDGD